MDRALDYGRPSRERVRFGFFLFAFFERSQWQEDHFAEFLSPFSFELLSQGVPAFGANVVFFAVNFFLQTVFYLAAEIASNH